MSKYILVASVSMYNESQTKSLNSSQLYLTVILNQC